MNEVTTSIAGTQDRPVVLITGCSSGIGLAAARRFATAGFRVYATMRGPEQRGAGLRAEAASAGWTLTTPALDVTSDDSVDAAVGALLAETGGRIDAVINNAGYYCVGPLEETSPDELRAQLETNVIGVLRVTRAVLPAMRARGQGAIVNLSSVTGRVVLPVVGPYHASKFALEAMTEALRYEVYPFGIRVVAVEPGAFATALHDNEVRTAASQRPGSPYAPLVQRYQAESARLKRGSVAAVAEAVFRAATHPRPPLRWRVGPKSFQGGVLRSFLPDAIYELAVRLTFRLRRPRRP
jgi:NAD(P)-dependent dehydrogenase (short-subunit alcohol dehydrogenase family)